MIDTILIGGTFDAMHIGHQEYIHLAFEFGKYVHILLTSDSYARHLKSYPVKPCSDRETNLLDFIQKMNHQNFTIQKIESRADLISFALKTEISMVLLVPEYRDLFEHVNHLREMEGKKPFLMLIKPRTKTVEGFKLSSTRLYHSDPAIHAPAFNYVPGKQYQHTSG